LVLRAVRSSSQLAHPRLYTALIAELLADEAVAWRRVVIRRSTMVNRLNILNSISKHSLYTEDPHAAVEDLLPVVEQTAFRTVFRTRTRLRIKTRAMCLANTRVVTPDLSHVAAAEAKPTEVVTLLQT